MKRVVIGMMIVSLAGCKGWLGKDSPLFTGGGHEEPGNEQVAEGRWMGTSLASAAGAQQRSIDMLVLPGAYAYLSEYDPGLIYSTLSIGQLTVDGGRLTSTRRFYRHSEQGFFLEDGTTSFEGNVSSKSSMSFTSTTTVDSVITTANATLAYVTTAEQASAFSRLAGSYGRTADDVGTQTITIGDAGSIDGSNGTCAVTGQASIVDASKNFYSLTLNFASLCSHPGPMNGWAMLDYNSADEKTGLTVYAKSDAGDVAFLFRGIR